MKYLILFPFLLLTFGGFAQVNTFMHDTKLREYLVHLPPGYTATSNMPLLIALHGGSSTMHDAQAWFDFDEVGDTANFITVYPQSLFATGWNSNLGWPADDLGFVSAMIDTMLKNYSINSSRVYAAGFSSGGEMVLYMGCELDDKLSAIASVGANLSSAIRDSCNSGKFVSLLHMHGTGDQINLYNNLPINTDSLIRFWVGQNNCTPMPVINNVPDTNLTDNSSMTTEFYGNGQQGSEVMFYKGLNMGHQWPGNWWPSPPIYGNHNLDIEASVEIWNFFKTHMLISIPEALQSKSFKVTVYPNPMKDAATILFDNPEARSFTLEIFDIHGRTVRTESNIRAGKIELDRTGLRNGFYYFQLRHEEMLATGKLIIE